MAVFETRVDKRATLLADGRSCTIPWEVLAKGSAGSYLRIGLYGTEEDDGVIVRSTIWADNPYRVLPGPDADPGKDPTPDQYQQMLALTSKVASRLDELDSVESSVKCSEQKAAASATAASSSAAMAKNSAAAAQTSATAATGAKTGAEKAQGEAGKAKTAAAISAHNAQVWAEGGTLKDADGGNDPSGARDGAKQFAEKAAAAKELAVQSATSAAGAQANASKAAQEAATRANQAQQSASAADSSRIAAETAAKNAKASETNAQASEAAAGGAAEAAQEAKTGAEKAQKSIENMLVSANTLPAGTDATVSKTVEDGTVKLNFGIPQGADGGAIAAAGLWGVEVDENGDLILTYTGDDAPPLSINEDGDLVYTLDGSEVNLGHVVGRDSQTPSITIGQVETLPAGSSVTASITGQTPNLVLNLGIPKGQQGDTGAGVPPADDVPTDYLLSVGGWVSPPESGSDSHGGIWTLLSEETIEEPISEYRIDLPKPCSELIAYVESAKMTEESKDSEAAFYVNSTPSLNTAVNKSNSRNIYIELNATPGFTNMVYCNHNTYPLGTSASGMVNCVKAGRSDGLFVDFIFNIGYAQFNSFAAGMKITVFGR